MGGSSERGQDFSAEGLGYEHDPGLADLEVVVAQEGAELPALCVYVAEELFRRPEAMELPFNERLARFLARQRRVLYRRR